LYSLTESGQAQFPRDYEGLATDLLSSVAELDGTDKVTQVLRQRSDHMTARYLSRMKGKNLEKRVREVAAILTEGGYMAEVKPLGRGLFLLTELNCAIPRVAKSFPQISRGTVPHSSVGASSGDASVPYACGGLSLLLPDPAQTICENSPFGLTPE
jgi:predicted ArsR family transcriptional regulator